MTRPSPNTTRARRFVVMGVSGTGKSTVGQRLAAALNVPFLEGDALHPPANLEKMSAGRPLDDGDREAWLSSLAAEIASARAEGQGLVLSCSALKRRYRDVLRAADPDLVFVHLTGDPAVVASRMHRRVGHYMPVSLLASQLRELEPLGPDETGICLDVGRTPDEVVDALLRSSGLSRS